VADIGDDAYLRRTDVRQRVRAQVGEWIIALDEEFMGDMPAPVVARTTALLQRFDDIEREQELDDAS
jgi:hypothetical protein